MNLKELFWMQKELDAHILEEQKLKKAPFDERVLALIVEMGECANEWKGFKYWKVPEKRTPRTKALRKPAMMEEDQEWYNPLLEEFVDKLHFVLSLGLDLNVDPKTISFRNPEHWMADNITDQFLEIAHSAYLVKSFRDKTSWEVLFKKIVALGQMLGFTSEEIETAYLEKNAINHARQVLKY